MMVYVLPVLIGGRLLGERMGALERLWCLAILLLGLVSTVAGTALSLWSIVVKLRCAEHHLECGEML